MAVTSPLLTCTSPIFKYEIEMGNFGIQGKDSDKFRSIQGNCFKWDSMV